MVILQAQHKSLGQVGFGLSDVRGVQRRNLGQAKHKGLGPGFGQSENPFQVVPGSGFVRPVAGQQRVFGVRPFHIHKELVHQAGFQQRLHNAGQHAVGVQFQGQPELAQLLEQRFEIRRAGGFAPADHNAFEPPFAGQ